MTHTPGPWKVVADDAALTLDVGVSDYDPGTDAFKGMIAWLSRTNLHQPEQVEANARLIAAAPELLAFAKQVLEEGWLNDELSEWSASNLHYDDIRALGDAAIAKAEGRDA